jgi:hypothetical protein
MEDRTVQIGKALGLDIPAQEIAKHEIIREATQESAVWAGCMSLLTILPRETRMVMLFEMVGSQ